MEWHSVILLTFLMNHILHLTSLWWIQTLYLFFFKISFFCRDKSCLNLTLPLNTHRYQLPPNVPWLLRFYCRWKAVVSTFSPPGGYSCSSLTLHCQPPPSVPTWGRGVKFCLEGDGSSGQIWRRWQTKLGFGHHHNFPHLSWHPTLPIPDIKCWKTRKPWYFYCEPPCVRNATTYYHCVRETHLRKMWRHQIRARALFTDAWCPSNQVYYIISKVNLSKKLQTSNGIKYFVLTSGFIFFVIKETLKVFL